MNTTMLDAMRRNWWLLLLRGLVALAFGVLTLGWPGVTLLWLILVYGIYALADGVLALGAAIKGGSATPRGWLVIAGIAGIAVGILTFVWPGITALVLVLFISAWAIVNGVMQIVAAIRLRKEIEDEWLLIAGGVISVLFGAVLFARPGEGAVAVALAVSVFAIVYGVLLISFSLCVRGRSGAHAMKSAW